MQLDNSLPFFLQTCALPYRVRPTDLLLFSHDSVVFLEAEKTFFVLYDKYPDSTTNKKDPYFLAARSLYGAWTQNLTHHPSHAGPTPDAPGVAACDHHTCWACPTGPDYFTRGRSGADCSHCHHGRDQPALCLQVGAAVSAGGSRGIGRPTRSRPSACVVPAYPTGAARRGRMTRLRRRGRIR